MLDKDSAIGDLLARVVVADVNVFCSFLVASSILNHGDRRSVVFEKDRRLRLR